MVVRYTLAQVAEAWGKRYTAVRLLRKALEEGANTAFLEGEIEFLNGIILQED